VAVRAKRLTFEIDLDRAGRVSADDGPPLDVPPEWSAEHLVLGALARCSLASLRYHVRRAGGDVVGEAAATGIVTRREDGRWAFVEIECRIDVELEPTLEGDPLRELLANAERDCIVSASLQVVPDYRWRVNGTVIP
jgi:uncharacterized OsmC-like protein